MNISPLPPEFGGCQVQLKYSGSTKKSSDFLVDREF